MQRISITISLLLCIFLLSSCQSVQESATKLGADITDSVDNVKGEYTRVKQQIDDTTKEIQETQQEFQEKKEAIENAIDAISN